MERYTNKKLLKLLSEACEELNPKGRKRGGKKIWAKKNGISPQYLSELLLGRKPLLKHIVNKIVKKKDLVLVQVWVQIPKHMRKRKNWSLEEIMQGTKYDD